MRKNVLVFAVVFMVVCLATGTVFAAAVSPVNGIGARTKGMGGAGVAVADGATMFYLNPALLAGAGNFIQIGMDYTDVRIEYTDPTGARHSSEPGKYALPLLGTGYRLNKNFSIGLGVNSALGFGSDFKHEFSQYSEIGLMAITPTVAYKTGNWSFGASLILGRGQMSFAQPVMFGPMKIGRSDSEADGWGYGLLLGAHWRVNEKLSLGASYQSPVRVDLSGRTWVSTIMGKTRDNFDTSFTFPAKLSVGAGLTLGKLLIAGDITWFDYSAANRAYLKYNSLPNAVMELNWKDTLVYNLGAEYRLTEQWLLRAGVAYQGLVIPNSSCTPGTPDMNGISGSIGAGWRGKNLGVDVAYVRAWGTDRTVPAGYSGAGKYGATINIFSSAITYRW